MTHARLYNFEGPPQKSPESKGVFQNCTSVWRPSVSDFNTPLGRCWWTWRLGCFSRGQGHANFCIFQRWKETRILRWSKWSKNSWNHWKTVGCIKTINDAAKGILAGAPLNMCSIRQRPLSTQVQNPKFGVIAVLLKNLENFRKQFPLFHHCATLKVYFLDEFLIIHDASWTNCVQLKKSYASRFLFIQF